MTETDRTQVTLLKFHMELIDDCIGILGYNRSQVISTIIQKFFQDSENQNIIEILKNKREELIRKQFREKDKEPQIIEKKIEKLLSFSDKIPLNIFIEYLNIDKEVFYENFDVWAKKFDLHFENSMILKLIEDKK